MDCGANIGLASLYFKTHFPSARITAFEPDPHIFNFLKDTIKNAGLKDVELISKAIWSSETTLRFRSEGADAGRIEEGSEADQVEIKTVRLRDYLSETIDFLKIDVEGAETEVLLDSAGLLTNVRNLFVEYHSFSNKAQTLDQILAVLNRAGFRVQIHPMMVAAKPFVKISEYLNMDQQLNIFAYRNKS